MFGRGKEHGQATVVAREVDDDVHRYGVSVESASDRYHNGWTYVADVRPDSGAPAFRATFRARFSHTEEFHEPVVGADLHESGALTDEEFAAEKAKLLGAS